jgi:alpha-N-acetylglucosaminidase
MLSTPSARDTFHDDIVNIGTQMLGNHFTHLRDMFTKAYEEKNLDHLKLYGQRMLDLLVDMDHLLGTSSNMLLGKWIEEAKKIALNETEEKYYERNARNIITTWGNKGNSLNDYANRSWNGLMKSYYKVRWQLFVEDVISAVSQGEDFDETKFNEKIMDFEESWSYETQSFKVTPEGNSIEVVRYILDKYSDSIKNIKI